MVSDEGWAECCITLHTACNGLGNMVVSRLAEETVTLLHRPAQVIVHCAECHMSFFLFFFLFITEHTQETPGLPMLQDFVITSGVPIWLSG